MFKVTYGTHMHAKSHTTLTAVVRQEYNIMLLLLVLLIVLTKVIIE